MALLKTKEALYPNARWGDDPIWWAVIDSLSPNGSWRPDGGWLLTHKTGIRVSASFRGERKTSLEPAALAEVPGQSTTVTTTMELLDAAKKMPAEFVGSGALILNSLAKGKFGLRRRSRQNALRTQCERDATQDSARGQRATECSVFFEFA